MRIGNFRVDEQLEQNGVWVDAGEGLRLRIARLDNPRYEKYVRKLGKPFVRQLRNGRLDDAVIDELTRKAMAKHVLLDWENLEDDDGTPIPYSESKALELLTEYRDFYRMVLDFAQEAALYKQEETQDAEGNSKAVSAGS